MKSDVQKRLQKNRKGRTDKTAKIPRQPQSERAALLSLCKAAGVLPDEMFEHPEHGLCVTLPGVEKIVQFAPDQERAASVVQKMMDASRLFQIESEGHA